PRPEQCGDHQNERESHERMHAELSDHHGNEDTGKGDDRTDRKIDAAGNNDECHADGGNAEKGIVGQKIADHPRRQHVRKLDDADRIGEQEDCNRGQERQIAKSFHCRAPCWLWRTGSAPLPLRSERRKAISWTMAGDWKVSTITMMTALMMRLNSGGKPAISMPVLIDWMMSAPSSEAMIEKRPPLSDVPPMTTARMASSSSHSPALLASAPRMSAVAISPARAAPAPETA